MAKLLIQSNNFPDYEIELKPGANRFGRTPDNDFPIEDESISSSHCEMTVGADGKVFVRDLGSTNGTFLNRELVSEGFLGLGEKLHLGDVEIIYTEESDPAAAPEKTGLRVAKAQSTVLLSQPMAQASSAPSFRRVMEIPRQKTFFKQLPSAFVYPFESNGLILLVSGTLLFVLLDFVGKFSLFLAVLAFGYLFLYMQTIVQSSAQGESEMPGWPELSNWWDDILLPAFLLAATFAVSFGPAVVMFVYLDADPGIKWMLGFSLAFFGCCYLPMALLAVSMYDTLFALNPLLIIPSILRIPKEYLIACVMLGVVLVVRLIGVLVLEMMPIPLFPTVVGGFLSLYFLAVEMRILGVMFHSKREELNWKF